MKCSSFFVLVILSLLHFTVMAQYQPKSITPYNIAISYDKTSNLIFPSSIKSVDRGSSSVIAQKAPGVENVLQLKAGEENFKETNVTVITSDGHFYSFAVNFNPSPANLNYSFVSDSNEKAIIANQPLTYTHYQTVAEQIQHEKISIHKSAHSENLTLSLHNLFTCDGMIWLRVSISNDGLIPFMPSYIRVFIQDKKKAKNAAMQQTEIHPLNELTLKVVATHSMNSYIIACRPFSIPDSKELIIETGNLEGAQHLMIRLSGRIMRKIKSLPQNN